MLKSILPLIVGTTITLGGVSVGVGDIIEDAKKAVNSANVHQLSTAIELYHSENNRYPLTSGGENLINELSPYLRNKPLDSSAFEYSSLNNGQDYDLSLK